MRSSDRRDANARALLSVALGLAAVIAGATPWVGRAKSGKTTAASAAPPPRVALR